MAILSFGEVLWDAFGDEKQAGGAPMNVALHLAKQGADVLFGSSIGADESGDELVEFLQHNGLYSDLIQRDEELPTCEVTVQLDENQQATYIIPQPVSWDNIQEDDELTEAAKNVDAVIFGSLACRTESTRNTLLNVLEQTQALKIFDVNLRAPYYTLDTIAGLAAHADVVKMNDEELKIIIPGKGDLKDKITEFRKMYHAQTLCITRGEQGALVWHDYEFYQQPGYTVEVVDTVGAGDSFLATFVNGLLKGQPIPEVLDKACAVGAYVAGKRGANPDYDEQIKARLIADKAFSS